MTAIATPIRSAIQVAKGISSYIPGIWHIVPRKGTGGTDSASYCYGVWLKHLTLLHAHGYAAGIPTRIGEIGPGDSLGVGVAALLSGASEYHAMDVVRYSNTERTLHIFNELVGLMRRRLARPIKGWPDFDEYLDDRLFPGHILTEEALEENLRPDRLAAIRAAILRPGQQADGILLNYAVPWTDTEVVRQASLDVVLSHSVLEHVADLPSTYSALSRLLRPGGWMTHQIDFSSHGLCEPWNGHRAFSDVSWKLIVGRRSSLINRQPPSVHLELMRNNGFEIVSSLMNVRHDGLERQRLAPRWRVFNDEDLRTLSAFVQARRMSPTNQ